MRVASRTTSFVVIASAVFALAGCGGGGGGSSQKDETPVINKQPYPVTVTTGETATFEVGADGGRLHYTWLRNGQVQPDSVDNPQYTLTTTYRDQSAKISVIVTNDAGQIESAPAQITLALSADQAVFNSLLTERGGDYKFSWDLPLSGTNEIPLENYFVTTEALLPSSPLGTPPVFLVQTTMDVANTLPIPSKPSTRILANGQILQIPYFGATTLVSYVLGGVEYDVFDSTNAQVVETRIYSNFSTVNLSGTIATTPTEMTNYYNSIFSNTSVLNQAAPWQAGAAYTKYTEVADGDEFFVVDCNGTATTTSGAPNPCLTGATSLTAALTNGIYDPVNKVTHVLKDGALAQTGGDSGWIAAEPLTPQTTGDTPEYLTYYFSSGTVYQGYVIKSGSVLSGNTYTDPTTGLKYATQYGIRINPAAYATIKNAVQF